jgi:hypothetical protein
MRLRSRYQLRRQVPSLQSIRQHFGDRQDPRTVPPPSWTRFPVVEVRTKRRPIKEDRKDLSQVSCRVTQGTHRCERVAYSRLFGHRPRLQREQDDRQREASETTYCRDRRQHGRLSLRCPACARAVTAPSNCCLVMSASVAQNAWNVTAVGRIATFSNRVGEEHRLVCRTGRRRSELVSGQATERAASPDQHPTAPAGRHGTRAIATRPGLRCTPLRTRASART